MGSAWSRPADQLLCHKSADHAELMIMRKHYNEHNAGIIIEVFLVYNYNVSKTFIINYNVNKNIANSFILLCYNIKGSSM